MTPKFWLVVAGSVSFVLLLGACGTTRDVVKVKGAEIADQLLTDAEWAVCQLAPVGSVKRRYGQTVERADTYKDFCDGDGKANVVSPK